MWRQQNNWDWKIEICFWKGRKTLWEKKRKCWQPAFSPFSTMFSKCFFFKVIRSQDCVEEDLSGWNSFICLLLALWNEWYNWMLPWPSKGRNSLVKEWCWPWQGLWYPGSSKEWEIPCSCCTQGRQIILKYTTQNLIGITFYVLNISLTVKPRLVCFFSSPEHNVLKRSFKGGDVSDVRRVLSTISLNIFSSQTTGPIWTKLGRNVPWEVLFKICSQNLNFLSNSLKIFSSKTAGQILK